MFLGWVVPVDFSSTCPLLVLARAKLSFPYASSNRERVRSMVEKTVQIDSLRQCVLSVCSRNYSVSVTGGKTSIHTSESGYGKMYLFHVHADTISDPEHVYCWKPGYGASTGIEPVDIPPGGKMWTNATEFSICSKFWDVGINLFETFVMNDSGI
ncbi:hypothetical protein EYZ11_007640 [Aspergillus tanneri]|uniref:Uncharacterized protein n=1 Tax=Aspergillus tanneri TaxID=1220188 RepID=A0A4S3JES7_9EURO|nr:hypothetical protein EYZ11_007640 [Aspergillus tanneri]